MLHRACAARLRRGLHPVIQVALHFAADADRERTEWKREAEPNKCQRGRPQCNCVTYANREKAENSGRTQCLLRQEIPDFIGHGKSLHGMEKEAEQTTQRQH